MSIVCFNVFIGEALKRNRYDTLDLREPTAEQYLKAFRTTHPTINPKDILLNVPDTLISTTTKIWPLQKNTNIVVVVKEAAFIEMVIKYKREKNYFLFKLIIF